ncbi:hypothetical protein BGZ60DRAFT_410274 [Tricladium varicosporioides]|nr:hypothetical protein BGZ60DRAFT_410274 [Hymenoscyphus varicosporioides]
MEPLVILSLFTFCVAIGSRSIHAKRIWHWFQQHRSSQSTNLTSKLHLPSPPPRSQYPIPEKQQPIHTLPPYVFPALAPKIASQSSMGLKRLDVANWLSIDKYYHSEHDIRTQLLAASHSDVIQVLPGAELACHEVLSLTVAFLTTRYPQHFTITSTSTSSSPTHITNHLTSETFSIGPSCSNPLETAARLAMEDFNVLMKNEEGEYCLLASATLFPAGWKLRERVGMSMAVLHAPVPGWKDRLGGSVSRLVSVLYQF